MANISQRLDLKLGQSLVMTPQLQQAIKMLQMSNQELTDYVLTEVEQNPLLERADPETGLAMDDGGGGNGGEEVEQTDNTERQQQDDTRDTVDHSESETYSGGALDTDYDNVWSSDGGNRAGSGQNGEDDGNWLEQAVEEQVTLRDHLVEQIQLDITEPQARLIALLLLEHLDEAGYCKADLPALAAQLGIEEGRILAVLKRLQAFDPPGIFARNLSECLALQLYDKGLLTDEMETLIENLPLLAEKSFGQLEKLCGATREELGAMMQSIKQCNPKPAFGFDVSYAATVIPDVIVKKTGMGQWLVELNSETLPKVLVNERYFARVKEGAANRAANKKELEYLQERYATAHWLVKALHQRATTILKVGTAIVEAQENFFNFGLDFLKPMTLKDIATIIQMHESTVSRVTTGKYMATPKGVYELKYFFSTALTATDGSMSHAATSVKNRIKALIDAEDPKKILSDDQIVTMLKGEGIDIARRTVAKYREALRIGSSTERRRLKSSGN